MSALAEAQEFLYRHPWATSDVDNPVEILSELATEAEALNDKASKVTDLEDELEEYRDDLGVLRRKHEALVQFVKRLRDEHKISDFELRDALGARAGR